jgi:LacI family transcriptional regulator
VSDPFYADIARGVQATATEQGIFVSIWETFHDQERTRECVTMLLEQRVRGVILGSVVENREPSRFLAGHGMPVVIVGVEEPLDFACSLSTDDVHGGELAMEHLLHLGHERIGFVGGTDAIPFVADRVDGARRALKAGGLDPQSLSVLTSETLSMADGRAAGLQLSRQPAAQRPTAVLCANDLTAMGLIQALIKADLRVPEDVAVVGYDDVRFAEVSLVPLTTIRQPGHAIGRCAADQLLDSSELAGHRHTATTFKPELIVRASTTPRRAES